MVVSTLEWHLVVGSSVPEMLKLACSFVRCIPEAAAGCSPHGVASTGGLMHPWGSCWWFQPWCGQHGWCIILPFPLGTVWLTRLDCSTSGFGSNLAVVRSKLLTGFSSVCSTSDWTVQDPSGTDIGIKLQWILKRITVLVSVWYQFGKVYR